MGRQKFEDFTPEEIDEQIDQYLILREQDGPDEAALLAIQRLQQHYTAAPDATLALKRVQQRLAQQMASSRARPNFPAVEDRLPSENTFDQKRNEYMQQHPRKVKRLISRLSILAAAALFIILIGGALVVVRQAYPNAKCSSTSSLGACATSQPTKSVQLYTIAIPDGSPGDETVYRLDPDTNKPLWHFSMKAVSGGGVYEHSYLYVVNGILYFKGTGIDGYYFYALKASDGLLLWKFKYAPNLERGGSFFGGPLVANGMVYLPESSQPQGYGLILALDASSGKLRWQERYEGVPDDPKSGNFSMGLELVATTGNTLYATRSQVQNQQESWSLYALNAQTGAKLWQKQYQNEEEVGQGQLVNGVLYLAASIQDSTKNGSTHIYAYDAATGNGQWSITIEGSVYGDRMRVVQNTIYASTSDANTAGHMYALRASDGSVLWQQKLAGRTVGMTAANDEIYAIITPIGGNGRTPMQLEAFRATNGQVDWQHTVSGETAVQPTPAVYENYLYFGDSNKVNVLNRFSGKLVKTFTVGNGGYAPGNNVTVLSLTE